MWNFCDNAASHLRQCRSAAIFPQISSTCCDKRFRNDSICEATRTTQNTAQFEYTGNYLFLRIFFHKILFLISINWSPFEISVHHNITVLCGRIEANHHQERRCICRNGIALWFISFISTKWRMPWNRNIQSQNEWKRTRTSEYELKHLCNFFKHFESITIKWNLFYKFRDTQENRWIGKQTGCDCMHNCCTRRICFEWTACTI